MILRWLGHASFMIEIGSTRIVTDPFNEYVGFKMPAVTAELVTLSHGHRDHAATDEVLGSPQVVDSPGEHDFQDIVIHGTSTFHDKKRGKERGNNIVFTFKSQDLSICHLGDLGHILETGQVMEIGPVDVLLIPVGGLYTISAAEAVQVRDLIKPRLTVPMHYKTPDLSFPLSPVEDFIRNYNSVVKLPFLEISSQEAISLPEVVILDRYSS